MARWFDVYLKTTRQASPRKAETMVIESHPGSSAIGASRNLPKALAATLSQATSCASTSITRCTPGPAAARPRRGRPHRSPSGPVPFR